MQAWMKAKPSMNRCSRFVWLGALLSGLALPGSAAQFKFGGQTLTVPDGFEVQQVAGPPLVNRPVTADFDEQGRLYVTDSSGSNEKVDKQLQEKPHRMMRLEDRDGDGVFKRGGVFADHLMFPEGCLWFQGALYVAAPPSIWKLRDTDGDGVADQREEWFQGKTLTGCANDLHGPYRGPDGWLYWCKGAFATQTYPRPGKAPFVTRASHIFRTRPDGSGIEPVLTGGMDNPVSVAFTSGGERILTGTFFVHPGGGQRDGLIHAIYGGVYGKEHDVLDGHKRTGDLMPIMTHHGPAASCFVMRYESGVFGEAYRDNLFACLFNLHKVTRHVLVPDGATFQTRDEDFLVSDNPDFHPTDVLEDADGSLLIIDTGGWYKICCPTSQLSKPDVLGAIYRVRRLDAPRVEDPRGLNIRWQDADAEALSRLLSDPRPVVCRRAIDQLARKQLAAIPALKSNLASAVPVQGRRNAVWALTRIEGAPAREAVRLALSDSDESVRQAAAHSVSLWRDAQAVPILVQIIENAAPQLQRVAAEALGRIGDTSAIPALLGAASLPHDRVLEHSLIYALIEIDDPPMVRSFLRKNPVPASAQRAALIALDQMDGGALQADMITPLLASSDPVLRKTGFWIVGHHPDWASGLAGFFRERLAAPELSADDRALLEQKLGEFARDPSIQDLLAGTLKDSATPPVSRVSALRAMALAGLKEAPSAWTIALEQTLNGREANLVSAAVSAARSLTVPQEQQAQLAAALQRVGRNADWPVDVRLQALAAVPGGLNPVEPKTFALLTSSIEGSNPVLTRGAAASILAKASLNQEQLLTLADTVKSVGPMEVPKLLGAFQRSTNEEVGLRLVSSLKASPGLASLRPEILEPQLTNFPSRVRQESESLLALLKVDAGQQQVHLDELSGSLKGGDVRRGQAVFNSQKAACSSCHAMGYLGGNVGPDLTRIGQIRTERDLLESIVYPSASFVRSFEPVVVMTKSGDDYSGVVRKDAAEELVLATGPGAEVRIARSDIVEMRPGTVSVMPAGLDQLLTGQDLADLVAFLKNAK
jgi:putative membrane-bound dehydrogenase-like protein